MKRFWFWAVGVIAFAFWYDGKPVDDDDMARRFREVEGM